LRDQLAAFFIHLAKAGKHLRRVHPAPAKHFLNLCKVLSDVSKIKHELITLPNLAILVLIRDHPRKSAVSFGTLFFPIARDVARSRRLGVLRSLLSSVFQGFGSHSDQCHPCRSVVKFLSVDKKIFWLLFTVLGALMGILLPLWWNLVLTLPLLVLCWWVVYRSGWFS
jgi:hypothetical protein